jgi:hypothetical protein
VLVLIIVAGVLGWAFGIKTEPAAKEHSEPAAFHVNRLGTNGAFPSIAAALAKIHNRGRQPARIVVEEDVAENDVIVDVPNITIEAVEGKGIRWKPSSQGGATKLLLVHKAEGFRLKGFTLDGDNRTDCLISIFHRCPAARFEDLRLQGFKKYAIWLMNCEGGNNNDQRIILDRLIFEVPRPEQTALFFSIEKHTRDTIPKNRFITFGSACQFAGPGTKVRTPDFAGLEDVQFPAGVRPVQGE